MSYTICPKCKTEGGHTPFHGPFECINVKCDLWSAEHYEKSPPDNDYQWTTSPEVDNGPLFDLDYDDLPDTKKCKVFGRPDITALMDKTLAEMQERLYRDLALAQGAVEVTPGWYLFPETPSPQEPTDSASGRKVCQTSLSEPEGGLHSASGCDICPEGCCIACIFP